MWRRGKGTNDHFSIFLQFEMIVSTSRESQYFALLNIFGHLPLNGGLMAYLDAPVMVLLHLILIRTPSRHLWAQTTSVMSTEIMEVYGIGPAALNRQHVAISTPRLGSLQIFQSPVLETCKWVPAQMKTWTMKMYTLSSWSFTSSDFINCLFCYSLLAYYLSTFCHILLYTANLVLAFIIV